MEVPLFSYYVFTGKKFANRVHVKWVRSHGMGEIDHIFAPDVIVYKAFVDF